MSKKFQTIPFSFRGRHKFEKFKLEINISSSGEFYFWASLIPEEVRKSSSQLLEQGFRSKHDRGTLKYITETYGEIASVMRNVLRHHEQVLEQEGSVKVILYRFNLHGDLTPDLGMSDEGSVRYDELEGRGADLGLQLRWGVYNKNTINGETAYFTLDGMEVGYMERKMLEIAFTSEREQWFQGLEDSLRKMLTGIHHFMKVEPKAIEQHIDTGKPIPFLLGSDSNKKPKE